MRGMREDGGPIGNDYVEHDPPTLLTIAIQTALDDYNRAYARVLCHRDENQIAIDNARLDNTIAELTRLGYVVR